MNEKRKKKEKASKKGSADSKAMAKEEDAIARFLRFNCPTNTTFFEGNEVHYFSGKKAVDTLVESKKYGANGKTKKFVDNSSAIDLLQILLENGLFFRAKKMVLKKKEKIQNPASRDISKSPRSEKMKSSTKTADEEEQKKSAKVSENDDKDKDEQEEKRKKKVKLLFNEVQAFELDTNDVYVWIFDPTPLWKKCVGILIVLGTIGGCLFPLWPDWLRLGIYYLSLTGIALFGLLLGVALARTILFGIIWLFTMGRHHLWVLPNLMEDCGFFESFKPFYTYEYKPGGMFAKEEQKKKKERKRSVIEDEIPPLIDEENEDVKEDDDGMAETEEKPIEEAKEEDEEKSQNGTEIDSEEAQCVTDESNSWDNLSENSQEQKEK